MKLRAIVSLALLSATTEARVASVQQVSVTIPANAASGTATIANVDPAKTVVFYERFFARVELSNGSTVTARRNKASPPVVTVSATVVQFDLGMIQSVQSGTLSLQAQSINTVTVTPVVMERAALFWLGSESDSTQR